MCGNGPQIWQGVVFGVRFCPPTKMLLRRPGMDENPIPRFAIFDVCALHEQRAPAVSY
jgi:hypothetical protein